MKAQLYLEFGTVKFFGEGKEEWLATQLDKLLANANNLMVVALSKDGNQNNQSIVGSTKNYKFDTEIDETHQNAFQVPYNKLDVENILELPIKLVGTVWRKHNGLETVFFKTNCAFMHNSGRNTNWTENKYQVDETSGTMELTWSSDGFHSKCNFDSHYSRFSEFNKLEFTWYLISK